jgi:hypothetical protein
MKGGGMMRVLICGDREWCNRSVIMKVIQELKPKIIIEGGCRGVDTLARECANILHIEVHEYRAEWQRFGRAAGPIRNKEMIEEGRPSLVVAFHNNLDKSSGTKNMVKQAKKYYIPVKLYNSKGEEREA